LLEQLPVDGPQGHGVNDQLVALGSGEYDEFEKVGGTIRTDDEPSVGVIAKIIDDEGMIDRMEHVIVGDAMSPS
jgi:hypothetical protein